MTDTITPEDTQAAKDIQAATRRLSSNVLFAIIAMVGVLIASYPSISQWITALQRADTVTGYTESLERAEPEVLESVLTEARAYNAEMPGVLVTDPYSLEDAKNGANGAWEEYLDALSIPGTDVMATVRIPSIEVNLPVGHGTSDATLAAGAGHLFGSSLPVGGERSHSVITAHTALSQAHLFDDLDQVEMGDLFHIDVAGETLSYRVDQIDVVLPHEVESLQLESGRDLVTLVTCAPPTINTHRLLVRGERVDIDAASTNDGQQSNLDGTEVGFPWWMLWVSGSAVALTVYALKGRKAAGGAQNAAESASDEHTEG